MMSKQFFGSDIERQNTGSEFERDFFTGLSAKLGLGMDLF